MTTPGSACWPAGCWRPAGSRWSARPRTDAPRSAIARELRPDLVLLDVQLPDIDGFEVTARLAAGEVAPVVVLTSTRDRGDYGERVTAERGARLHPQGRAVGGCAPRPPGGDRMR